MIWTYHGYNIIDYIYIYIYNQLYYNIIYYNYSSYYNKIKLVNNNNKRF